MEEMQLMMIAKSSTNKTNRNTINTIMSHSMSYDFSQSFNNSIALENSTVSNNTSNNQNLIGGRRTSALPPSSTPSTPQFAQNWSARKLARWKLKAP